MDILKKHMITNDYKMTCTSNEDFYLYDHNKVLMIKEALLKKLKYLFKKHTKKI